MIIAILSEDIPETYLNAIKTVLPGTIFLRLPRVHTVYESISSHPDIFSCQLDRDTWIASADIPESIISRVNALGITVKVSRSSPSGKYPGTAIFNAARVGRFFIHNLRYTDEILAGTATSLGLKSIHVSQGYVRCSIIPVDKNSLISEDDGVSKVAKKNGLVACQIHNGPVVLNGHKHGFLGGASGILPDGNILFVGDITTHQDFHVIDKFLKNRKKRFFHLPKLPLLDIGTVMFFSDKVPGLNE
jgi:hypothetical protein